MAACRHFQEWTERRKKTETTFSRFEHKMWKFGRKCKFFFIRFFPVFFSSSLFFLLWFFNVLNSLCHKIVDCSLLIIREMKKKRTESERTVHTIVVLDSFEVFNLFRGACKWHDLIKIFPFSTFSSIQDIRDIAHQHTTSHVHTAIEIRWMHNTLIVWVWLNRALRMYMCSVCTLYTASYVLFFSSSSRCVSSFKWVRCTQPISINMARHFSSVPFLFHRQSSHSSRALSFSLARTHNSTLFSPRGVNYRYNFSTF